MFPTDSKDPFADLGDDLDKPKARRPSNPFAIDERGDEGDADVDNRPAKAERPTFPCQSCAGSGRWQRGVNQHGDNRCFACAGRGYFLKSRQDRDNAKAKRAASKATRIAEARAAFDEMHPGLVVRIIEASTWMGFAASMVEALGQYGALTDNQTAAIIRSLDKADATKAAKRAEKVEAVKQIEQAAAEVTDEQITALFGTGLKLSRAKANSSNPGAIYAKKDGEYLGKIKDGRFFASSSTSPEMHAAMIAVAKDPKTFAIRYGKLSHFCAICSTELTDPKSIAAGIGPICAKRI